MLSELYQDRAALYVSGAMPAAERESFEVLLEFDPQLRAHVGTLQEAAAVATFSEHPQLVAPPAALRERVLRTAGAMPQAEREALVVTDAQGGVVWINDAFTQLCGYTIDELRGRKPGHLLQGPDTDATAVARIREALRAHTACREELVNYHKDGSRYRAEVRISPFLDDDAQPLWFVARERKLADTSAR